MRSNELRIGNYLDWIVKEDVHFGIARVEGMFLDHGQWFIDNDLRHCIHIDELKPIPLTEEWLIKFGFERSAKTFVDGAYAVTFRRAKDGGWAIYDTSTDEGTNYLTPNLGFCEHVHQLQNLYFALTNIELTIKE
jgi:hypothetical protein